MASAYEEIGLDDDPLGQLHARSHGEQFLDAVRNRRFGAGGLFVMEEPEAALSFESQLALMRVMREYSAQGSQFKACSRAGSARFCLRLPRLPRCVDMRKCTSQTCRAVAFIPGLDCADAGCWPDL